MTTVPPPQDRELILSIHEMLKRAVLDIQQIQTDVKETRGQAIQLNETDIHLAYRVSYLESQSTKQNTMFEKIDTKVGDLEDEIKTRMTQLRTIVFLVGPVLAIVLTFAIDLFKSWLKVP